MVNLDDVVARLDALEAENAELRGQLARRVPSMQQARCCPVCGGGSLLRIPRVKDANRANTIEMCLHHTVSVWRGVAGFGKLEAFVCRSCRLVEWSAVDLDGVVPDGVDIIAIEPDEPAPPPAPYR